MPDDGLVGGIVLRRLPVVVVALGVAISSTSLGLVPTAGVASATTSNTPIVVGGDVSLAIAQGISQGFEAGIYRFNKAGGLNGRKIKFVGALDDGFSSATNLSNARKLVASDHVMVVAPLSSAGATAATGTYLAQQHTPFIGYSASPPYTAALKWGFGVNGNQDNANQASVGFSTLLKATGNTKTPGKVKLALIANDYPTASAAAHSLGGVSEYLGMKVVYSKSPVPVIGTTNYQPYAQQVIASGANAVFLITGASDAVGLSAALKADGFKGFIGNGVTYFPGQLASQPNEKAALDNTYLSYEFPVDQNNTPAVKQAQKDLQAVGESPHLIQPVSVGYWSAIVFEQMLKATLHSVGGDPNKVTSQTLDRTVNAGFTYTDPIPGGIGTEHFPAAELVPTGCGTLVKVVGSGYQVITPYQCSGAINIVTRKYLSQKTGK
jgi:ABC-type branched-subunit amino acid transport system substrate-binding protein